MAYTSFETMIEKGPLVIGGINKPSKGIIYITAFLWYIGNITGI